MEEMELETITIKDFPRICRICLIPSNLYPINCTEVGDIKVPELLDYSISVRIKEDTVLPQNICGDCLTELYTFYKFKKRCYEKERLFKSILEVTVKADINSDEDQPDDNYFGDPIDDVSVKVKQEEVIFNDVNTIKEEEINITDVNQMIKTENDETKPRVKRPRVHKKKLCTVCQKYVNSDRMSSHMAFHTKPFKCETCARSFGSTKNLARHEMTHTGERPCLCYKCGKGFIRNESLQIHLRRCVGNQVFARKACSICGIIYTQEWGLRNHIRKHVNQDKSIAEHLTTEERRYLEIKEENTARSFLCEACPLTYKTSMALRQHINNVHGTAEFPCTYCEKTFRTKYQLASHLKVHTGEKPFSCPICSKTFAQRNTLNIHMNVHQGNKPHKCRICFNTFSQKPHLVSHMRIHTGEKSHSCKVCGKSFALNGNLTVHMRRHTGETPYVCSVCDRGFYDSSSLKKHKMRYRHDIDIERREDSEEDIEDSTNVE